MSQVPTPQWITPEWPAPPRVRAAATLRTGGVSRGAFASLNLGSHVGDDPAAVTENRRLLKAALGLPAEPAWLNQVHSTNVVALTTHGAPGTSVIEATPQTTAGTSVVEAAMTQVTPPTADGSVALAPAQVCAVLTADCLPVLFCDRQGTRVAAAHAGWRGLAGGVLGATVRALGTQPSQLLAWMGPAIEPEAFEVGPEVREQFLALDAGNAAAFSINSRGRWQADLYTLARRELARLGVTEVTGGGLRCYADSERFFSYRRDARTGRMATLIWLEP